MKLKDLFPHIRAEKTIVIWKWNTEDEDVNLFRGKADDIPVELMEAEVGIIGAKRKEVLDIEIK